MIREGHKLPKNVIDRIPELIEQIEKDTDVVALYSFGSLATGNLKPLSDLDLAFSFPTNSANRSDLISILILSANLTKF